MDNEIFVNKLIKGTKENKFQWEKLKSKKFINTYQTYTMKKNDKRIVIEKYDTIESDVFGDEYHTANCSLSVCDDSINLEILTQIFESDLKKGNDLMRLYRLAERQANKVDDIMESIVEDIDIDF